MPDLTNSLSSVSGGAMHASAGVLPVALPDPLQVTDAEATEAAQELGLVLFSANRSRALKRLGLHYCQGGVVMQGVGRLAVADGALQELLERSLEIAKDTSVEAKVAVDAIQAGRGVADAIRENVQYTVELQQEKLLMEAPKKPKQDLRAQISISVPPGAQVTATEAP